MSSSNRVIAAILAVAALAIGFWALALGPKRDQANKLSGQVEQLKTTLAEAQAKAAEAASARQAFPVDYRQLVVLGQAVPADDETSSLLVELNTIASSVGVRFNEITLESSDEAAAAAVPAPAAAPAPSGAPPSNAIQASSIVPPTEAAASLLPLGASVGPAGLAVMPYNLSFSGNFFQVAEFIKGLDRLVHANGAKVAVDGRLLTVSGFALNLEEGEGEEGGAPQPGDILKATFHINTYVTPPAQGITAGATPSAPAPIASPAGAGEAATQATSATESSSGTSPQAVSAR
jgi:Tfp pilus assembly protein PilO